MKESLSIKGLNNKIDKLFEDELEDLKIIKDMKDVITRYENANDYKKQIMLLKLILGAQNTSQLMELGILEHIMVL